VGSIPTRSRHLGLRLAGALAAILMTFPALAAQQPDSLRQAAGAEADTLPGVVADSAARPVADSARTGVRPLAALARSIVVPGWGQASVGKPVRGAFYFAAEAGSLFMVVKSQQKLDAARRAVDAGQADSALVRSRVSQREDWIVLSAFWALLSGVDAWVSANLSDFQQPLTPPPDGSAGAAVQIRIPVGVP
jgi:hypothetical protein